MFRKVIEESQIFAREFCKRSQIHGFAYTTREDITSVERWFWRIMLVFFFFLTIYICILLDDADGSVTVTTLATTHYPVEKVQLPAVGVCSINKISKARLTNVAAIMASYTNKTMDWLLNESLLLGRLQEYIWDGEDYTEYQDILEELFARYPEEWPSVRELMFYLSISCNEFLEECHWMGRKVECDLIFNKEITDDGYCCLFNSEYNPNILKISKMKSIEEMRSKFKYITGLRFLINHRPDDYFYSNSLFDGALIKIFNGGVFPDTSFGEVKNIFVGGGNQLLLSIEATHNVVSSELRKYPISVRECTYFMDENVFTTMTDCYVDCKIKTIYTLCGCVPYTLPLSEHPVCSVMDLACLSKFSNKISSIHPVGASDEELGNEREDSLPCLCYPGCMQTTYQFHTNYNNLYLGENHTLDPLEASFVNIFYSRNFINLYETDYTRYWFRVLSNMGGVCGITLGISIVSLVEMVYFFICFIYTIVSGHRFLP